MTSNLRFITGAAVGAMAFASLAGPAFAGAATDAYVAGLRLDMDVLTKSSTLAADKATGDAVKAYAAREFGIGDTAVAATEATDVPTFVAANMTGFTTDETGLQTARSADAGTVVDPMVYAAPLGAGVTMPTGAWSLAYLATTTGKGFDWTYKAVQDDALTSLIGLTEAYAMTGDDPGIRAEAIGQLPKLQARLAELRSL